MDVEVHSLSDFRRHISQRARLHHGTWEASRRLIEEREFPATVARLLHLVHEKDLPASIKEPLCRVFGRQEARRVQDLDGELLKILTGFPPAKALRALCIYFELIDPPGAQWPIPLIASETIERQIRCNPNPFDLLLSADVASVLDLGAGDLSFAAELAELYVPELQRQNRGLILHCLDRLDPRSKLGGPLHPNQDRLRVLRDKVGPGFFFWGNRDMFDHHDLDDAGALAPKYTIATCWAPATPAFAYEPTRLSQSVIAQELYKTKGFSRSIRFQGEPALEVLHGDRALLFPPWKFEVIGPRALLNLLAGRSALCVLGAVDNQVFWEILAQLLEEPRYRPQERPFTDTNIPEIFGNVYRALHRLSIGDAVNLADIATLRRQFLSVKPTASTSSPAHADSWFRYVRISRGATFPGFPASSTARMFPVMAEETTPWFLTLIPS
ncbi:MAG: hypothetical protein OEY28_01965 [Nitrospira sp.]|nr:hypothetical protein [Nitrospira sp.]